MEKSLPVKELYYGFRKRQCRSEQLAKAQSDYMKSQ